MEIIEKYFPDLTPPQKKALAALHGLYADWNARINVISRRDVEHLYERHVLHSLALARVWTPTEGARVLDVGTGGGFPGIPLAIIFPDAHFTLVDSIGKKTAVASAVAQELGLANVTVLNARAETVHGPFDYVVSRAVAPVAKLIGWVWPKIARGQAGNLTNGMLLLKGGDLTEELAEAGRRCDIFNISDLFDEEFFETKKIIHLQKK